MSVSHFYVYQLRLVSEDLPFYVGKGHGRRAWDHFHPGTLTKNTHKNNVIRKALRDGVEILVEKIFEDLTNQEALTFEVWTIASYGRKKFESGCLTNQTLGGEGRTGDNHSKETIALLALLNTGRVPSAETRAKISAAHIGRVVTLESRLKVSATKRAQQRKLSDEQKKAISDFHTGKVTSDETKQKMSVAMTGLKRSEIGKANMRAANQLLPKLKCQHCDVWAVKRQWSRYHNNNCKSLTKL